MALSSKEARTKSWSKRAASTRTCTGWVSTRSPRLQVRKLGDAALQHLRERLDLGGRIAGGSKSVVNLPVGKTPGVLAEPLGVGAGHILPDVLQVDPAEIFFGVHQIDEARPRWNRKVDGSSMSSFDENRASIGVDVVFRTVARPTAARRSEACAQVAHHIGRLGAILIDSVVLVLEIPVVDQRHQGAEPVPFASIVELTVVPLPVARFLLGFFLALQSHIVNRASGANQFLAAMQLLRHAPDLHLRHEIIFVGEITGGPHQACGHRFGTRFEPQFHLPLGAIRVRHYEFWVRSGKIFFHEREGSVRFMVFAANAIVEVTVRPVRWVGPEYGCSSSTDRRFWRLVGRPQGGKGQRGDRENQACPFKALSRETVPVGYGMVPHKYAHGYSPCSRRTVRQLHK